MFPAGVMPLTGRVCAIHTADLLGVLHDLRICCTGFDSHERESVEDDVLRNGGIYSADLTEDCTHLIVKVLCANTARGTAMT